MSIHPPPRPVPYFSTLNQGAGGLNTRVVVKIIMGWAVTMFICGLSCALIFAQGAYAPYAYDSIDLLPPEGRVAP